MYYRVFKVFYRVLQSVLLGVSRGATGYFKVFNRVLQSVLQGVSRGATGYFKIKFSLN